MSWRAIAGFRLVTQAPEHAVAFYIALGFEFDAPRRIAADEIALLGLSGGGMRRAGRRGGVAVDLDCYDRPGATYPAGADATSIAFQHLALVAEDVADAWARAEAAGATAIGDGVPVTLPASSGGVTAVKFRDPEGHPLELIGFPDDAARGAIDHSAIVVGDVDAAIAFYTGHGLRVGRRTLNHGAAQDRLDGVTGVEADVVPLLPEAPAPHLELLGYRRPRPGGVPVPAANDVAATRIVWQAGRDALIRDPDGHLHQLIAC